MDANIFQPAYDPNRMPQRLGISKIEETILNQFVSLQEDLIESVIFGSDFMQDNVRRSVDDERTNPSYRDLFLRLDHNSLDIMQNNFCEKGIEEFERLKRNLRDAQTEEGTLLCLRNVNIACKQQEMVLKSGVISTHHCGNIQH